MKKFNELYRPAEQGISYERYCAILDDILVEHLQEQDKGFDALSKKGQQDYLKLHPKSKKAVTAKDKEKKDPEKKDPDRFKYGDRIDKYLKSKGISGDELDKVLKSKGISVKGFTKALGIGKDKDPEGGDSLLKKKLGDTKAGRLVKDYKEFIKNTDSEEERKQVEGIVRSVGNHIGEIAETVGLAKVEVVEAFKDPSVYNTLKAAKFSVKSLGSLAYKTASSLNVGLKGVSGQFIKTKTYKNLVTNPAKYVDKFLDENPNFKKFVGVGVAGFAAFQWLNMSFSGDIKSDYDVNLIGNALDGKYSIKDILSTPSGVAGLGLLGAGLATGGLTIWIPGVKGLALAMARNGLRNAGRTKAAEKVWHKMQMMKNTMKKRVIGENQMQFKEIYSSVVEKDEHKKSKEYKRLSPKMRDAVDDTFKKLDSKPSDFLNSFEKTIKDVARKYRVSDKDLLKYFEREMLTIG